jgi:hypothetical protein
VVSFDLGRKDIGELSGGEEGFKGSWYVESAYKVDISLAKGSFCDVSDEVFPFLDVGLVTSSGGWF